MPFISFNSFGFNQQRQSGAALIMALLIVALISVFALKASRDYQLNLARAEARWHGAQARAYLIGAERLAVYFLQQDDPSIDSLQEEWAQPIPPFPVEGGRLLAEIHDASARVNLNDLTAPLGADKAAGDHERYNTNQRRFLRLLQSFEVFPIALEEAAAILEAIIDWADSDNQPTGFFGAEADYYQSLDPPYRPANAAFTSVDELRLVRGVSPPLMQLLRPYLMALPAGSTPMNINTLPDQLLRTFNAKNVLAPLALEDVRLLREENIEYVTVEEFKNNSLWSSLIADPEGVNVDNTATATQYFVVTTTVALGQQRRTMESLLQREAGAEVSNITVVARRDLYDFTPAPFAAADRKSVV